MNPYHLLVIGFDEIVSNKYLIEIQRAAQEGYLDGYSIVDLESQKSSISSRIEILEFKPKVIHYLKDDDEAAIRNCFAGFFCEFRGGHRYIRAYIATEVKAHDFYLRFFASQGVSTLVEKPVFAPMINGEFRYELLNSVFSEILDASNRSGAEHSVMTLSRYHKIYNEKYIDSLLTVMERWDAPVTSLHLRHSGGVWNRQSEYDWREDHPYKYGYGMMMHGAYHYLDLAAQILTLNKCYFDNQPLRFSVTAHNAFPKDQWHRIPKKASMMIGDNDSLWANQHPSLDRFGETDIVSAFKVTSVLDDRVIALGTLSFEQTTPSIRSWGDIPDGLYNKNGRSSMVDIETQLSVMHASHVRVFDVPIAGNFNSDIPKVDRIDAFARIERRSNGALDSSLPFIDKETHGGLFHSDSNKELMRQWLKGNERKSNLLSHDMTVKLTQALLQSAASGQAVAFEW
jgi:hypothetical protein